MTDAPKDPNAPEEEPSMEQLEKLNEVSEQLAPKEHFKRASHIGLLMAYDLIDKLRYWEKETLTLPDEQVAKRLDLLISSVEHLRVAYLDLADLDS